MLAASGGTRPAGGAAFAASPAPPAPPAPPLVVLPLIASALNRYARALAITASAFSAFRLFRRRRPVRRSVLRPVYKEWGGLGRGGLRAAPGPLGAVRGAPAPPPILGAPGRGLFYCPAGVSLRRAEYSGRGFARPLYVVVLAFTDIRLIAENHVIDVAAAAILLFLLHRIIPF